MGSVVACRSNQVRFSFRMEKWGQEYGCALTVKDYEGGIIYLEDDGGMPFCMAACAAAAFLSNTSSIGTAKRILRLKKEDTVKAVCIDLMQGKTPRRILMPKNSRTDFTIKA